MKYIVTLLIFGLSIFALHGSSAESLEAFLSEHDAKGTDPLDGSPDSVEALERFGELFREVEGKKNFHIQPVRYSTTMPEIKFIRAYFSDRLDDPDYTCDDMAEDLLRWKTRTLVCFSTKVQIIERWHEKRGECTGSFLNERDLVNAALGTRELFLSIVETWSDIDGLLQVSDPGWKHMESERREAFVKQIHDAARGLVSHHDAMIELIRREEIEDARSYSAQIMRNLENTLFLDENSEYIVLTYSWPNWRSIIGSYVQIAGRISEPSEGGNGEHHGAGERSR